MSTVTFALLKEILDKSRKFFEQSGLTPCLLALPLEGPSAESNKDGIKEKILKNKSQIEYEVASNQSSLKTDETVETINEIVDKLTHYETVGFVLLITEYIGDETGLKKNDNSHSTPNQHRPVAGGIVEFVDEYERSIRAMWCRRSLPALVVEMIVQVLTLQIIAYSFNCEHPNISTKQRISNKLLSVVDSHCITFPRDAYNFLTSSMGLNLGKHWETPDHGGNHNDSPHRKCQCQKLANKQNAFQFWGISETRFISNWSNKKDSLIPQSLSPEMKDIFLSLNDRKAFTEDFENQKRLSNKTSKRHDMT